MNTMEKKLRKYNSFSQKKFLAPSNSTFGPFKNINGEKIFLYSKKNFKKNKSNIKVGKVNFTRQQKIQMISKIKRSITKNRKIDKISKNRL